MMKLEVYCSVNNCNYWSAGNKCHANEILITSDSLGASKPDNYDAPDLTDSVQTPCNTCMETCCKSFVPVNTPEVSADGIVRQ